MACKLHFSSIFLKQLTYLISYSSQDLPSTFERVTFPSPEKHIEIMNYKNSSSTGKDFNDNYQ